MNQYEAPSIEVLGSLQELTLAKFPNKVGPSYDIYTSTAVPIIGSIVPQK